jgi:hypothetical protein
MIVEEATAFAAVCTASVFLPLDRTLRLGIFVSGTSAIALYVAKRSPRDAGRMAVLAAVLWATLIAYVAGHSGLSIRGGGPGRKISHRRGHAQHPGLRSAPFKKATVDYAGVERQLAQLGNLAGRAEDVPRGRLYDAHRELQRQLSDNLDTLEFDDAVRDLTDFRQKFANLPCTALALAQHKDICWVVSVLDLIYNTPLLRMVGDATREWVVSTYIESLKNDEREVTCRRLPPHIEAVYAPLASRRGGDPPYRLRSTFESDGGFPDLLLFAIFLADGVLVPSPTAVYAVHELAGTNRTGLQVARLIGRSSAANIGAEIDRALREYDLNFESASVILLQFDAPEAPMLKPNLMSPWFRELAVTCKARGTRDVYGGVIVVDEHAISFTVCYRHNGEVDIVPRTYGVAGFEAVANAGLAKVEQVTLVVRTGER